MIKLHSKLFSNKYIQIVLFIIINSLFILKYSPRYGLNPYLLSVAFIVVILIYLFLYHKIANELSEKIFRLLFWVMLAGTIIVIVFLFKHIDPYTIRVDRWSALTFFWDSVFKGQYPYITHTHVCTTNFASPFPVWHVISLPFYLLGDVGIEIIFFLLLLAVVVKYYFSSYRKSFFFISLLLISPAYWWEVSARSDSLSNGLLVFMIILYLIKTNRTLINNFKLLIVICGLIAATRFTAIIPLALFLFQPYLKLSTNRKIIFPFAILGIAFIAFCPFIFWDIETWIFFTRNPFMSQTANGNLYVFLFMFLIGITSALTWKSTQQFFNITSLFIFFFILIAQLARIYNAGEGNLFSDAISDISYFNLSLPYCLAVLTTTFGSNKI